MFVTGVNNAGGVQVPQGSSLNHAIALAGRTEQRQVEFVQRRGRRVDRRIFGYKQVVLLNVAILY